MAKGGKPWEWKLVRLPDTWDRVAGQPSPVRAEASRAGEVPVPLLRPVLEAGILVLFAGAFASFIWAMASGFFSLKERRVPPSARVVQLVSLLGLLADASALTRPSASPLAALLAAVALYGSSLWLFWSAWLANGGVPLAVVFTQSEPARLTMGGPYRLIRHPFYSAYLLAWLAAPVATWSSPLLLPFLTLAACYVAAALREEREFLGSPLRSDYVHYRRRAGMFLPRLRAALTTERTGRKLWEGGP